MWFKCMCFFFLSVVLYLHGVGVCWGTFDKGTYFMVNRATDHPSLCIVLIFARSFSKLHVFRVFRRTFLFFAQQNNDELYSPHMA